MALGLGKTSGGLDASRLLGKVLPTPVPAWALAQKGVPSGALKGETPNLAGSGVSGHKHLLEGLQPRPASSF